MHAWMLAAALALAAPQPPTAAPVVVTPPQPTQLMALPPELRQRLHEEVIAGADAPRQRLERLVAFMLAEDGLRIAYDEDATHSVAQTYATRRANCLSFTLLFVAMARAVGLDAGPQEIGETLSWRQEGGTLYRNSHVNTGVRIDGRHYTVDVMGEQLIARDRPLPVPDTRLLAHYFNNLAMATLAERDTAAGLPLMATALSLDGDYAPLWSNAGVLHLHSGDVAAAERAYARALLLDPEDDGALFNMIGLARRLGDARREAEFRRRLARVQQRDPLHQFMQAMDHERNGDYGRAIDHYLRAIRLHRGEHRFHAALARAYLKAGDTRRAGRALARAQALSAGSAHAAYRAQLQELRAARD